jgi:hypothetical protein
MAYDSRISTDWRHRRWTTRRNNHVSTFGGSARVVWCDEISTDVAYVVPTDDDNGNSNALFISLAPDIFKCLLVASGCLDDSETAGQVRDFVSKLKEHLDANAQG